MYEVRINYELKYIMFQQIPSLNYESIGFFYYEECNYSQSSCKVLDIAM